MIGRSVIPLPRLSRLDDGQAMLQTDLIAQSLQREGDEPAVLKFPVAGEIGGIKDDVIVDVRAVRMGCDDERVLPVCEAHRRFVSNPVRLFRRNLAGLEGLSDLVRDNISRNLPPGNAEILFLREQKFLIDSFRIAGVGGDILTILGFLPILCIVGPILQTLPDGFSLIHMHYNQPSRRHLSSPPLRHQSKRESLSRICRIIFHNSCISRCRSSTSFR